MNTNKGRLIEIRCILPKDYMYSYTIDIKAKIGQIFWNILP